MTINNLPIRTLNLKIVCSAGTKVLSEMQNSYVGRSFTTRESARKSYDLQPVDGADKYQRFSLKYNN
jgi:hypothetical protein